MFLQDLARSSLGLAAPQSNPRLDSLVLAGVPIKKKRLKPRVHSTPSPQPGMVAKTNLAVAAACRLTTGADRIHVRW